MDATARRSLALLGASFALLWTTISLSVGPGSAAFAELTGRESAAGAFVAITYVAVALGSVVGGAAMDRLGRKPVLVAGQLVCAAGFGVAGLGVAASSAPVFATGAATLALGLGLVGLLRIAAAELVPPAERGRAVARVAAAGTVGAIAGPLLLIGADPLASALGRDPRTLVWALAPPLLVVGAVLTSLARGLRGPGAVATVRRPAAAPRRASRPIVVTAAAMAAAQSAMAAIMGVTGAALAHAGHTQGAVGGVMLLHFAGMFGLSLVVGRVADAAGRPQTVAFGLALIVAGCAGVASGVGALGLALSLSVIGLGWSFAYIGATAQLTDLVPVESRGRVVGRVDLVVSLVAGAASLAAGWWYAERGMDWLGVAGAVVALVALVPLVALGRGARPTSAARTDS